MVGFIFGVLVGVAGLWAYLEWREYSEAVGRHLPKDDDEDPYVP